jgi:hypothetical protein
MDYREQLPFDEYIQRLFLPALNACAGVERHDGLVARAALFESLRWLELGIEARLFSFSAGKKLLEDYGSEIAAEYRRFPNELHYLLPELTQIHLRKMTENRELSVGARFENSARIAKRLAILMERVAVLNADTCSTSLSAALMFLSTAAWERLLAGPITGTRVLDALAGTSDRWADGHRGHALGGCLQAFKHLEGMVEALDYLHRPEGLAADDWATLRQVVFEIHGWRFAFRTLGFLDRFASLCSLLSEIMEVELASIGVSVEHGGLNRYMKDLVDRWNGLGIPLMKQAAQ